MEKESFVLYNSFYEPIKALKNEQLGKLLRAIFNYTIDGEITQDSDILVAFMFIKNQLDIDGKKWEEIRMQRSIAGKKGMESRWSNKNNNVITKITNDNNVITDITKITDNVNVNVNDNVINKKENIKRKNFIKPTIEEIQQYCIERYNGINANAFYDFYESKNWYVGKNKMKDWKACVRTWEQRNNKTKKEEPTPSWFDKDIKEEQMTKEEQQEMEDLLSEFK